MHKLLLTKCFSNIFACGATPTEHLLNTGRRCQTSKKRSQSPQNEAGEKIRKRKVDKGFCDGHLHPGAGV